MRTLFYAIIPTVLLSSPSLFGHGRQLWNQLIALPNGTLIYYLWVNERKANQLLNAKSCNEILSYVDHNAKKDNYLGPGIYASSNIYDSNEFGNILLELHVPPHAKDLIPYPKPGHDNIIWYFTRDLRHLQFYPFTGTGLSNGQLERMLFKISSPFNEEFATPSFNFLALALWQRRPEEQKKKWQNSPHAITFIPGLYHRPGTLLSRIDLRGFLLLKNLSYHKKVTAHYTIDNWKTIQSARVVYAGKDPHSEKEIWSYAINNLPILGKLPFLIYFTYENLENGEIYYESREEKNFTIHDYHEV